MDDTARDMLAQAGWAEAAVHPLAGDASARRYVRLVRADGAQAVLMCAPPDGSTLRFAGIARHLRAQGLSAPAILADRAEAGFLLLEDLGDTSLAAQVAANPGSEAALYDTAVDLLAAMQAAPVPEGLVTPDADILATATAPALTWYADRDAGDADALAAPLRAVLAGVLAATPPVFVHRDFHAENLMWLPSRCGAGRLGVIDFQDAFAGPGVYDLVSLTEDARRDIASGLADGLAARYARRTGRTTGEVMREAAILGAQRNLRILGVFARLSRQDGKLRYIDLIPRVWRHLQGDLAHPDLAELRARVAALLPPPHPDHLDRLRQPCRATPCP